MKKIIVLSGGLSPEREVSLRSGQACHEALLRLGYGSSFIDIQSKNDLKNIIHSDAELAFLTTHGEMGEDGALQGFLDWIKLPYTGSGRRSSALCMDKYLSKLCFRESGLPTAPFCLGSELHDNFDLWVDKWESPKLFIKPRWGGSSTEAKILKNKSELPDLKRNGEDWIVEPFIEGREFTVAYLKKEDSWQCLPILELRPKREFYDYESKYTEGMTEFICPAPLEKTQALHLKQLGSQALHSCHVKGYGRADFILSKSGPLLLEINTLPGMTQTSDLPAQAKEHGMSFDDLVEAIVQTA